MPLLTVWVVVLYLADDSALERRRPPMAWTSAEACALQARAEGQRYELRRLTDPALRHTPALAHATCEPRRLDAALEVTR